MDMLPPDNARGQGQGGAGRSVDMGAQERLKIQKKAWRSKKFFESEPRKLRCCGLCVIGIAVEHLIARTDYLDERQKGLHDLAVPHLNPFVQCREWLGKLVKSGREHASPLRPLFDHFRSEHVYPDRVLMRQFVGQALDMAAQAWWRFLPLHDLPFSLAKCVNSAVPKAERQRLLRDAFTRPECCVDADCTAKLRRVFEGDWKKAARDESFANGLRSIAWSFNFGNMRSERLLALIRRSLNGNIKSSEIETISSKEGFGKGVAVQ